MPAVSYVGTDGQVWRAGRAVTLLWLLCWLVLCGCTSIRALVARPPRVDSVADALATLRDSVDPAERLSAYRFLLDPDHFPEKRIPDDVLQSVADTGLREPEAIERANVVMLLGALDDPRVLDPLLRAADDPDPLVRQAACEQLARWHDERVLEVLIDRLQNDASIDVRLAAARSLGKIPSRRAAQALYAHLADPDVAIRYRAREALANLVGEDHGFDMDQWQSAIEQASFTETRRRGWRRWLF